ncbi:MAG: RNA polymerase sigma factor [Pseudomonadota bacterium]
MYATETALTGGSTRVSSWMTEATSDNDNARWSVMMAAAQQGDEQAYRALLGELAEVIKRYMISRFGYYDQVEDCVQECLLAIHRARRSYDPKRPFKPWLFAIVRHKAVDSFRGQRRHQASSLDLASEEELAISSQEMEDQLTQGQLIAALSPDYREAITLTKIIGLSSAEAAARLDISEGTLKVRVHRAIGRLKSMLEAEHHE